MLSKRNAIEKNCANRCINVILIQKAIDMIGAAFTQMNIRSHLEYFIFAYYARCANFCIYVNDLRNLSSNVSMNFKLFYFERARAQA